MKLPIRSIAILFTLLVASLVAEGRPVWVPSYQEMLEKSDLVVIATPVARKELSERTVMPGVLRGNEQIPAIQVETTFRISAILRGTGPAKQDRFVLLHLIEANPPEIVTNGQALLDFRPDGGDEYLLFLKKLPDGRYEAMNGQTDPAFSVRALTSAAAPPRKK